MKKNFVIVIILLIFLTLAVSLYFVLNKKNSTLANDKIRIMASIYPVAFFTQQIVGDLTEVSTITPNGVEPHDFEPSPRDIAAMQSADLVVVNGGGLEPWLDSVRANLPRGTALVVAAGGVLQGQAGINKDPHAWLDPVLAKQMAEAIAQVLIGIDSRHATAYEKGLARLQSRLDDLDTQYRAGLANCVKKNIVTAHAAFGYLAARYGLHQITLTGISPEQEPTAQDLAAVVQFVRLNHVEYIFFESLISPKLAETIARETGVKTLELNPLEGRPGRGGQLSAPTADYFTVMLSNLTNLKLALQCTP